MNVATMILPTILVASLFACDGKTPQSENSRMVGQAPKQTVDKAVNEANKAIEQGEARTREASDGNR